MVQTIAVHKFFMNDDELRGDILPIRKELDKSYTPRAVDNGIGSYEYWGAPKRFCNSI